MMMWLLSGVLAVQTVQPAGVTTPPRPAPGSSFRVDDGYPSEARRLGQEGRVGILVDVSRRGRGTNCRVVQSSEAPSLDEATCRLFDGIRVQPARDASGKAVDGEFRAIFNWTLPED